MKTVTINDREIPVVGYVDRNKTIPILDFVVSDEVWDDVRYWPVCLLAAEEMVS